MPSTVRVKEESELFDKEGGDIWMMGSGDVYLE